MTKPVVSVPISPLPSPSAEGLVSKELWRKAAEVIHNVVIPVLGGISVVLFYASIFFWNAYLVIPLVGSLALGSLFWALVDEPSKVPTTPSAIPHKKIDDVHESVQVVRKAPAKKKKLIDVPEQESPQIKLTEKFTFQPREARLPLPVSADSSSKAVNSPTDLPPPSTSWASFFFSASVFVDHPGIDNGGNTCFMNAAFQVFMNLPAYQRALLQEVQYRQGQLVVFQKMDAFFQKNSDGQALIEGSLQEKHLLLNAFLSQRIYNALKKKFPQGGDNIAAFLGQLKRFVDAGEREAPSDLAAELFWQILPQIGLDQEIKTVLRDCCIEHVKQINKMLEIGKFIEEYTKAKEARTACVGSLTALRKLLDEKFQDGQQDTSEWMANFFQLFAPYRYPELYFPLSLRKQYILNEELTIRRKDYLEGLKVEVASGKRASYDEEALDRVKTDYTNRLDVSITEGTLEELISDSFKEIRDEADAHEFIMQKNNDLCIYKTVSQQYQLNGNGLPKRFFCTLKRFSARYQKDKTHIGVSEEIVMEGKRYKVAGAIIHHGDTIRGGHYTSITKNERGEWFDNNDSSVRRISQEEALTKMGHGYVFFLEESV